MVKKYIYILIFLLSMFIVLGASSWDDFGNTGRFAPGYDGYFFSSAYLGGNLNFSILSDAITNEYMPIVQKPLDDSTSINNFIYSFTDNNINIFDGSDISLISSFSIPDICGQPVLFNYENDEDLEIIVMTNTGSIIEFNILEMTNSVDMTLVKNITLYNATCVVDTDYPTENDFIAVMMNNSNIGILNPLLEIAFSFNHSIVYSSTNQVNTKFPYFSRPMDMVNMDSDSQPEIIIGGMNGVTMQIQIFDSSTGELQASNTATGDSAVYDKFNVALIQIGTPTGNKEVLAMGRRVSTNNDEITVIFDNAVSILYQNPTGAGFDEHYMGAVGDINYDGLNEYCYVDSNTDEFTCYNALFTKIITISHIFTDGTYMAMGEYNNNSNDYMEFMTQDGLYEIILNPDNVTLNVSLKQSFDIIDENTMFYTTSLVSTQLFTKDILLYNNNFMSLYQSFGAQIVCGDGICSIGESILTCPIDCLLQNNLSSIGEICDSGNDCNTGKCANSMCVLKSTNEACSSDFECVSEDCKVNGLCAKSSLWQNVEKGKNEVVGDDDDTNNFISILIASGLSILAIAYLAIKGAGFLGAIVGVVVFIISCFFLALVGWLSGFILLGIILAVIFIIVVITIIGGLRG